MHSSTSEIKYLEKAHGAYIAEPCLISTVQQRLMRNDRL